MKDKLKRFRSLTSFTTWGLDSGKAIYNMILKISINLQEMKSHLGVDDGNVCEW